MTFLTKLFQGTAKVKRRVNVTTHAIQILENDHVVQSVRKAELSVVQIKLKDQGSFKKGPFFCFRTDRDKDLIISMRMDGAQAVEAYVLGLPGVNKQNLIALMDAGYLAIIDVWKKR